MSKEIDDKTRATRRCECKVCLYGRVVAALVARQSTQEDKDIVNGLYDRLMSAEDDRDYWRIAYHGGFQEVEKSLFHSEHCAAYAKAFPTK